MPCTDITEIIRIDLDHEDRLRSYALSKMTCGRAVGSLSLIADWVAGRTAEEILGADLDAFQSAHPAADDTEEFLYLKHLFALQSGLAVYLGIDSGGASDPCAAESIGCGPEGMEFIGQLRLDVLTEKIRSCGRCAGCGTKKSAREKLAAR